MLGVLLKGVRRIGASGLLQSHHALRCVQVRLRPVAVVEVAWIHGALIDMRNMSVV